MKRRAALLAAATVAGCAHHPHAVTVATVAPSQHSVSLELPPDRVFIEHASRSQSAPRPATPSVTTTTVAGGGQGAGLFEATCYSPPEFPAGQRTSSGAPVGPGSIAADPRIFPMGTRLSVSGWGTGVVVDTGGAIHGRRLDLWMSSLAACLQFGRRTVRVRRLP